MLVALVLGLILLWLAGLITSYTIVGFVQLLLMIAVVVVVLRVIGKKRST